jgi:hypothetical protein
MVDSLVHKENALLAGTVTGPTKERKELVGRVTVPASKEAVPQSFFVIASDQRERGNLFISNAL